MITRPTICPTRYPMAANSSHMLASALVAGGAPGTSKKATLSGTPTAGCPAPERFLRARSAGPVGGDHRGSGGVFGAWVAPGPGARRRPSWPPGAPADGSWSPGWDIADRLLRALLDKEAGRRPLTHVPGVAHSMGQ